MNGGLRYLMTRTWVSALSLVIAVVAAMLTYVLTRPDLLESCPGATVVRQGANIDHAFRLVAYSGIVALVALLVLSLAQRWNRLLASVLLLEGFALIVAIGLVAIDSATYVRYVPAFACLSSDPYTDVHHVSALYAVWGVPLALLLLRVFGAWTGVERPDPAIAGEPDFWAS